MVKKIAYKVMKCSIKYARLDFYSSLNLLMGRVFSCQLQSPQFPGLAWCMWVCPGFSFTSNSQKHATGYSVNMMSSDGVATHLGRIPAMPCLYIMTSVLGTN